MEEGSLKQAHDPEGNQLGGRSLGSPRSRIQRSFPESWGKGHPFHQINQPPSAGNSSQARDRKFLRIPQGDR